MHVPNSHVVFSPENNFHKLQIHQTLSFAACQDHSILDKSVSAIFLKNFGFNFTCVMFFSKIRYE